MDHIPTRAPIPISQPEIHPSIAAAIVSRIVDQNPFERSLK
jgi:hypothetical protein